MYKGRAAAPEVSLAAFEIYCIITTVTTVSPEINKPKMKRQLIQEQKQPGGSAGWEKGSLLPALLEQLAHNGAQEGTQDRTGRYYRNNYSKKAGTLLQGMGLSCTGIGRGEKSKDPRSAWAGQQDYLQTITKSPGY